MNLSTLTRKELKKDLRSRITDEHPDIARQGAAQRIWSFPAPLARTLRCSNAEGGQERVTRL